MNFESSSTASVASTRSLCRLKKHLAGASWGKRASRKKQKHEKAQDLICAEEEAEAASAIAVQLQQPPVKNLLAYSHE